MLRKNLARTRLSATTPSRNRGDKITRQKPNLSRKERKALHVLQQSKDLNFKKADKGNTLVVMDKNDKIKYKRGKSKSMT